MQTPEQRAFSPIRSPQETMIEGGVFRALPELLAGIQTTCLAKLTAVKFPGSRILQRNSPGIKAPAITLPAGNGDVKELVFREAEVSPRVFRRIYGVQDTRTLR